MTMDPGEPTAPPGLGIGKESSQMDLTGDDEDEKNRNRGHGNLNISHKHFHSRIHKVIRSTIQRRHRSSSSSGSSSSGKYDKLSDDDSDSPHDGTRALSSKVRLKFFRHVNKALRSLSGCRRRQRLLEKLRVHVEVPQSIPRLSKPFPPGPLPVSGVVIIGAGVFGLSTALTMARMSVRPIQVIEAGDGVGNQPDHYATPYQLHTPVSYDYPSPGCGAELYREKFITALAGFSEDEILRDYLCVKGYAKFSSGEASLMHRADVMLSHASLRSHPILRNATVPFGDEAVGIEGPNLGGFQAAGAPVSGYINLAGGMVETGDMLYAMFLECQRLGVRFYFNEPVESLWWKGDRCIGAATSGWGRGRIFHDDATVIVAAGASIPSIIPSSTYHSAMFRGEGQPQLEPISYATAHIRLTKEESERLQNLPVLHIPELGYVCAPDPHLEMLQLCVLSVEFVFSDPSTGELRSHPRTDRLPPEAERRMRDLLRRTLPEFVRRPFINARLNWTTKTADGDFVIDKMPNTDNVYVAAGDYDKSVGMLPILGREVTDLVSRGEQWERRWRWKAGGELEELEDEYDEGEDDEDDGASRSYYLYEYDPDTFLSSDDELSDYGPDFGRGDGADGRYGYYARRNHESGNECYLEPDYFVEAEGNFDDYGSDVSPSKRRRV